MTKETCNACGGTGIIYKSNKQNNSVITEDYQLTEETCPTCKGEGKVNKPIDNPLPEFRW